jgi:predicted AlkP superfamily phosphohydrolase/phosphomutase
VRDIERHVWDILSKAGKHVIVANIPSTHVAWKVNGYMVSGNFMTIDAEKRTYPRGLKRQIQSVIDKSRGSQLPQLGEVVTPKQSLERLKRNIQNETRIFQYLLSTKHWDFAFVVFTAPDRIQHRCWHKKEYILEIYQAVDRALSKLHEIVGENTIIFLVSDHGFGPAEYTFNLNVWLLHEGLLKLRKRQRRTRRFFLNIIDMFIYKPVLCEILRGVVSRLPQRFQASIVRKTIPRELELSIVDWDLTQAFSKSGFGEIYLNVRGREPQGIIERGEEYKRVRDEIINKLNKLRNTITGEKIAPEVYKKRDIVGNKYLDALPDLIILPNDDIPAINARIGINKVFSKNWLSGNHRRNGIFLVSGPGIKRDARVHDARIYDMVPTILHMYNIPIPLDIDGSVLLEIFDKDSEFKSRAVTYQKVDEKVLLREKIRALVAQKRGFNPL